MSGFEIAGAVLAAIPLIIHGLHAYDESKARVKDIKNYRLVIQETVVTLRMIVCIYRSTIEMLLRPLVLQDELPALLESTDAAGWKDEGLHKKLEERLGEASGDFKLALEMLNSRVEKLRKKLPMENSSKSKPSVKTASDPAKKSKRLDRIYLALWTSSNAKKLKELLSDIDKDVNRIQQFVETSSALELDRTEERRKTRTEPFLNIREMSRRFFNALNTRWPCQGRCCQKVHRANMILQFPSEDEDKDFHMEVLLSLDESEHEQTSIPWRWQAVKVESKETNIPPDSTLKSSTAGNSKKKSKGVAFAGLSSAGPSATRSGCQCGHEIRDLCANLGNMVPFDPCRGYLNDQTWQHHIGSHSDSGLVSFGTKLESLLDILSLKDTGPSLSAYKLAPLQKYKIATILSISVLQLYSTPWLGDRWDIADVHIPRDDQGIFQFDLPSLSQTFPPRVAPLEASSKYFRDAANESIYSLGVVLLQLSFQRPLMEFKTAADLDERGEETMLTERLIVNRLMKEIDGEVFDYKSAINKCIRCNFGLDTSDLEDRKFMQEFHRGVVQPLHELYRSSASAGKRKSR